MSVQRSSVLRVYPPKSSQPKLPKPVKPVSDKLLGVLKTQVDVEGVGIATAGWKPICEVNHPKLVKAALACRGSSNSLALSITATKQLIDIADSCSSQVAQIVAAALNKIPSTLKVKTSTVAACCLLTEISPNFPLDSILMNPDLRNKDLANAVDLLGTMAINAKRAEAAKATHVLVAAQIDQRFAAVVRDMATSLSVPLEIFTAESMPKLSKIGGHELAERLLSFHQTIHASSFSLAPSIAIGTIFVQSERATSKRIATRELTSGQTFSAVRLEDVARRLACTDAVPEKIDAAHSLAAKFDTPLFQFHMTGARAGLCRILGEAAVRWMSSPSNLDRQTVEGYLAELEKSLSHIEKLRKTIPFLEQFLKDGTLHPASPKASIKIGTQLLESLRRVSVPPHLFADERMATPIVEKTIAALGVPTEQRIDWIRQQVKSLAQGNLTNQQFSCVVRTLVHFSNTCDSKLASLAWTLRKIERFKVEQARDQTLNIIRLKLGQGFDIPEIPLLKPRKARKAQIKDERPQPTRSREKVDVPLAPAQNDPNPLPLKMKPILLPSTARLSGNNNHPPTTRDASAKPSPRNGNGKHPPKSHTNLPAALAGRMRQRYGTRIDRSPAVKKLITPKPPPPSEAEA